jgi:hypothetical protein
VNPTIWNHRAFSTSNARNHSILWPSLCTNWSSRTIVERDLQTGLVVVAAINSTAAGRSVNGRPRRFCVMCEAVHIRR